MRQHIVRFAVITSVACLLVGVGSGSKATPGEHPKASGDNRIAYIPEVTFEAMQESNSVGFLSHQGISYDRGKFAVQYYVRNPTGNFVLSSRKLYDGSNTLPALVWEYSPEDHKAHPDSRSCDGALSFAVRQMGDAAARRRYAIPAAYSRGRSLLRNETATGVRDILSQWRILPPISATHGADPINGSTWRLLGSENIAGQSCRIYETQHRTRRQTGAPPPYLYETVKSWIEPKSHLVLREETHIFMPPGSTVPPQFIVKEVKSIRFLKSIPLSAFQLPPGTRAVVPETMKNAVVPPGVTREPAKGNWAMTGVDLTEAR